MSDLKMEGENLENNEENIRRIEQTPLSELGEGGPAIVFDVPEDLRYSDCEVTDVLWNGTAILLWYNPPDFEYDYLHFPTEVKNNVIFITGYGPGVLSAEEVYETRTETANAEVLEPIYDFLYEEGIRFEDMDDD